MGAAAHLRLLAITAIIAGCVLQWNLPNLGNNLIPRNFFVAAMMCLACASCWAHVIASCHIRWRPVWGVLLIPPVMVALHATWVPIGSFSHYPWLAGSTLALMACFTIGLAQLDLSRSHWTCISRLLLGGTSLLCLITLLSPPYLAWSDGWFSLPLPLRATQGGFQQPNLLASFLATSIVFALWQQLRHTTPIQGWRAMAMLCLTVLHIFMVFKSGSRVGMLGLAVSMLLLGVWVHRFSPQNKRFGWWCLFSLLLAALLASWLGDVVDRLRDLAQGSSTTYRLSFIQACFDLWWQSPWWGHGLGTFSEKIVPVFVHLIEAGKNLHYTPNLGHPHNEVLLWAVETGAWGVLSVVGPWMFLIVWVCCRQSWNNLAWLACLFPISLHQFTEFPFHASTAHIWLWCMVFASGMPSTVCRPWQVMSSHWIKTGSMTVTCVLAFGFAWILADTGWVSHLAWKHRPAWVATNPASQSSIRASREFQHPILKTFAGDQFIVLNAPRLVTATEATAKAHFCADVLEMGKRWQNPSQWTLEKECLRDRGDEGANLLHQRKVNALTQ